MAAPRDPAAARADRLDALALELLLSRAAVVVAALALERQNCEADADVARVLRRNVADRLHAAVEHTEALRTAERARRRRASRAR
jgi:hypothetical protein